MFFFWHQLNVSSLFDPGNLLLGLFIDFDEIAAQAEHFVEDGLAQIVCRAHCLLFISLAHQQLLLLVLNDVRRVEECIEVPHEKDQEKVLAVRHARLILELLRWQDTFDQKWTILIKVSSKMEQVCSHCCFLVIINLYRGEIFSRDMMQTCNFTRSLERFALIKGFFSPFKRWNEVPL